MSIEPFLPSLTNLPVFYAEAVLVVLLLAVSSDALLQRLRRDRGGAAPPVRFRARVAVLLPAWALWGIWAGYGGYWLGLAGLVGGSRPVALLGVALWVVFLLLTLPLLAWLRGRVWADVAMVVTICAALAVLVVRYPLWLCEPLGHSGLLRAQVCTGQLYEQGRGGARRDPALAADWYRRAALAGNAGAQYLLANAVFVDHERERWLREAAEQGDGAAAFDLYMLLGQRDNELSWLQLASEEGHADARYQLARRLIGGHGVERDVARARRLLLDAASGGSAGAMRELALAYATDGILFEHSDELSRRWESRALAAPRPDRGSGEEERQSAAAFAGQLERLRTRYTQASGGDPAAQQAIASEILTRADGDAALLGKAYGWLERAAASGSTAAQLELAERHLDLPNATADQHQRGARWLIAAADAGDPTALRRLVEAYKKGAYGLDRDLERARVYGEKRLAVLQSGGTLPTEAAWRTASWEHADTLEQLERERGRYLPPQALARAARAGDPQAQYHEARELMERDVDAGVALLQAAAEGGFAEAQFHAALRVINQKGAPERLGKALQWLESAAAQGHRGAMYELGRSYLQGPARAGVARDPAAARHWLEKALADSGDVVYRYADRNGHGWIVTASQVQRELERARQ